MITLPKILHANIIKTIAEQSRREYFVKVPLAEQKIKSLKNWMLTTYPPVHRRDDMLERIMKIMHRKRKNPASVCIRMKNMFSKFDDASDMINHNIPDEDPRLIDKITTTKKIKILGETFHANNCVQIFNNISKCNQKVKNALF